MKTSTNVFSLFDQVYNSYSCCGFRCLKQMNIPCQFLWGQYLQLGAWPYLHPARPVWPAPWTLMGGKCHKGGISWPVPTSMSTLDGILICNYLVKLFQGKAIIERSTWEDQLNRNFFPMFGFGCKRAWNLLQWLKTCIRCSGLPQFVIKPRTLGALLMEQYDSTIIREN